MFGMMMSMASLMLAASLFYLVYKSAAADTEYAYVFESTGG
jgi:hypothetical protein